MHVLASSKALWTILVPPHPHIHISSGNKTTTQARGTRQSYLICCVPQTARGSFIPAAVLWASSNSSRTETGLLSHDFESQIFQRYHYPGCQLPVWKAMLTSLIPFKDWRHNRCLDLFQKMRSGLYFLFK